MTKNYSFEEGLQQIEQLIIQCKQANLFSTNQEIQLKKNKKSPLKYREKAGSKCDANGSDS